MKRLLIMHSAISTPRMRTIFSHHHVKEWIPLVSRYERIREICSCLNDISTRIDIGKDVRDAANLLKRPFFELTARIGRKYNSLEWWANTISERNTIINNLFLNCCYLRIADSFLGKSSDLCIIADNNSLIDSIQLRAKQEGYQIKKITKRDFKTTAVYNLYRAGIMLIHHYYFWLLARVNKWKFRKESAEVNPDIIIHTWVDEKCFGCGGEFMDRYFTILPEYYKGRNFKVATFVTLFDIKRSFWQALTFFRKSKDSFIIPEDYFKLSDYLFPFYLWLKRSRFEFNNIVLKGMDCSLLFKENNKSEQVNFTAMYYLLFKRLIKNGLAPRIIVDGFENLVSDKMIQLGARKFMPNALIFGFYHFIPPPNMPSCFTDKNEIEYAPLPDKIICIGERLKKILINEHFPENKIKIGTALRNFYLYEDKKNAVSGKKDDDFTIMLVLPIEKDAALEVFYKLSEALKILPHYKLLIKPHPMATSIVGRIKKDFPDNTEVLEMAIKDAVGKCDIVVSSDTNAAFDCLMADKEVIRVGRDAQLDFDPLVWFNDELGAAVYTTRDLSEKLLFFYENTISNRRLTSNYSFLLPELFSPVTEEGLMAFLP